MTHKAPVLPLKLASAADGLRHVFVRDLTLDAEIGIHAHEKGTRQRVSISIDLAVLEGEQAQPDELGAVVCYEAVANKVKAIIASGHINLVESLAERIAAGCLDDARVVTARVRVEKLDAIEEARAVGVEIERVRAGF